MDWDLETLRVCNIKWRPRNGMLQDLVEQEASIDSIRIDREAELKKYSCLRFLYLCVFPWCRESGVAWLSLFIAFWFLTVMCEKKKKNQQEINKTESTKSHRL